MEAGDSKQPIANGPATNQAIIEKAYALAYEYEQKYGNCPQCVLAAVQEALGWVDDAVFKAAHGLAGGCGLSTKGTCGALSGGALAMSARYGRERENFASDRFPTSYKLAKRLVDRFVAEFGSPICGDVHTKLFGRPYDLWSQADYKEFEAAGAHADKCPDVAGKVAMWTAELLLAQAEKDKNRR